MIWVLILVFASGETVDVAQYKTHTACWDHWRTYYLALKQAGSAVQPRCEMRQISK